MNDPYKTLGVSRNATEDEIKKTYRELARKYHPDNYVNNPLADLAEEKMKEINEAYASLLGNSGNNSQTGGQQWQSSYRPNTANSNIYAQIRAYISMGNIMQAESLLNSISDRNAEWEFLKGSVAYRKGWFDEAKRHYETACNMNPSNMEYRNALNYMSRMNNTYRTYGGPSSGMSGCDCCANLICADCCCELMGGDLISCC